MDMKFPLFGLQKQADLPGQKKKKEREKTLNKNKTKKKTPKCEIKNFYLTMR